MSLHRAFYTFTLATQMICCSSDPSHVSVRDQQPHTAPPLTGVVGCSQNRVFLYSQSQTDTAVVPPKCPHMYPFWTDTVEVLLQSVHACPSGTDTGGAAAMPSPISVLDGH